MSKLYSQLNDLTSQIENLEKENAELKERIKGLVHFNCNLQNALQTQDMNEQEAEYKLLQRQEEITELKTKLYDATVKERRLLKILNETSD